MMPLSWCLVYPYIIYCNVIWGGSSMIHINKIIILQKKIVRLITGQDFLAHTTPLFYRTKILKVCDIHTYLVGIHAYKMNVASLLSYPQHSYNTRNINFALPTYQRLTLTQHAISFKAPSVWNSIPQYIKQCKSLNSFKAVYKKYLLSNYIL